MRTLTIALLLLLPVTASAQTWTKPPNVPTMVVQDYNVTIAVWVQGSGVGSYIAVFEQHPDGKWYFADGDTQYASHFDQDYNVYGAAGWVMSIGVPHINPILASRFPPIGNTAPPDTSPLGQVNSILGSVFSLKMVNGIPILATK